jgi:hypothetical protein
MVNMNTEEQFPEASRWVRELIANIVPGVSTQWHKGWPELMIGAYGRQTSIRFDPHNLDDLNNALMPGHDSRYANELVGDVNLFIYRALGTSGFLPDTDISPLIINERREWKNFQHVNVVVNDVESKWLHQGLKDLRASLQRTQKAQVPLPEIDLDLSIVNRLIQSYEQNSNNLSSPNCDRQTLAFLKAAAVCTIVKHEKERALAVAPRVKAELTRQIYAIIEWLYGTMLADIQLPQAIGDFVAYGGKADEEHVADTLDALLDQMEPRLGERRKGAWQAFYSENADHLSQAANSMVELLEKALQEKCGGLDPRKYLKRKYPQHKESEWIEHTHTWIKSVRSNLHDLKHANKEQSAQLAESLMRAAEAAMMAVL